MKLTQTISVKLNERVVLFRHGLPVRALGPGRYRLWGGGYSEQRFSTDALVFHALPEVRAALPAGWYQELNLAENQRGVLYRDGVPKLYLKSGVHRYFVVDPSVQAVIYDVLAAMPPLTEALEGVIPKAEYVSALIGSNEAGVLRVRGEAVEVLGPGLYRRWKTNQVPVSIEVIDLRRTELAISGQDLLTRDKVSLRLSLSLEYAIADPRLALTVMSVKDTLYVAVQLAVRDYVGAATLDELLEGRAAMTEALSRVVIPEATRVGARITRVGVKDIILPGEMKTLLNRVIEAEKEAQANVILRREETAATRSLANTARVMASEPILLRLKELETLKDIATRVGELRVLVTKDGTLSLAESQLLAPR